jgi:hypothetical protein
LSTPKLEQAGEQVLRIDMVTVLVPATWDVLGAGSVPTIPNKDFVEGRLNPVQGDVDDLMASGMKLPGSLFEAEGTNGAGGRVGVRVGVYDTGGGDPIALVRECAARLAPTASVNPTTVFSKRGVRTLQRSDAEAVEGGSVICDYWAEFGRTPTNFVLLRFWRTGPGSTDEEQLFDKVAGSLLASGGPAFSGVAGAMFGRKLLPPDAHEVAEPDRFRYAGWRLGTVFRSKLLPAREAEFATVGGVHAREALLFGAVFFSWLAATLALVGVGPILMLGGMTSLGAYTELRSRGLKAVVVLALVLGGLLAFGVATS